MGGVPQSCGIYYAEYSNGTYSQPRALPPSINSTSQDWTPFIARDGSYIIFSSTRNGDYGDLFISYKLDDDSWSEAIDLGEKINTWAQERFPSVTQEGKYLFFTRYTTDNHHDIFWVDAKIIDELKTKVFTK